MTAENYDIVINEHGGITVKRTIDDIADSAKRAHDDLSKLNNSTEGFVLGLKKQADTLGYTRSQVLAYESAQLKLNSAQRASVDSSIKAIDAYDRSHSAASKNIDVVGSLKTQVIGLGAAYLSMSTAIDGGKAILDTALANERLFNTLKVGTGSIEGAAREIAFLKEQSELLGLQFVTTADQYGKLSAASRGTKLEGQATRDIFLGISKAATVLNLSAEQAGGALNAIQQMISKGKVSAEELRGQLGERLPGAFQIAAKAINVTTQELDKMLEEGKLLPEVLLPAMAKELEKTFGAQSQEAAQGLQGKINRLDNAFNELKTTIGNSGVLEFLASGIELATRFANALSGTKALSAIDAQKKKIIDMRQELESLTNRRAIPVVGDLLFDKRQADLLSQRIDDGVHDLAKLENAARATNDVINNPSAITPGNKPNLPDDVLKRIKEEQKQRERLSKDRARDAARDLQSSQKFSDSLKLESEQIGLNAIQKKMLTAATEASKAPNQKLREEIMKNAAAYAQLSQRQEESLVIERDLQKIKSIKDSVATPEERHQATRDELDRLRKVGLSQEDYARAIKKSEDELLGIKRTGRDAFGSLDQYTIQAARNIQTSLANFLFDPFNDGLNGMVSGVANAVRRMVAEFAAMRVAQVTGLSDLFGTAGSAGNAISLTGLLSSGMSFVNSANNGLKGGIGSIANFISGASGLKGFGAFGAGASGATSAGVFGPMGRNFLGGAGTALGAGSEFGMMSGMGSMISTVAGPLLANYLGFKLGSMIAGDKKVLGVGGNISSLAGMVLGGPLGAIAGGAITGLFGHGPLKFRQEALIGNASSDGFDGRVTDVYRAKGGLLVGNKHKELTSPNESALLDIVDSSLKGFGSVIKGFAVNLGASADIVSNFSKEIDLRSEKGKRITQEAVQELIDGLGNDLANGVLKQIDFVAKAGETNIQTLERLSKEFDVLNLAALSTGRSLQESRDAILNLPSALRTQVVDQLGGVDAAGQKINYFIDHFLSDAQKLPPMFELLNGEMQKLGFSASISRDDFTKLVQSVGSVSGITAEQYTGLLNLEVKFDEFDQLRSKLNKSTENLIDNEQSLLDARNRLSSTYQRERSELESTINRFKSLSDQIKGFREGLLLGELSPLDPGKKLDEARLQFNQTRLKASSGDEQALSKLPEVAQEFLKASQTYNASSSAYVSDFNLVQSVLKNSETTALSQIDIAKNQLDALDKSVEFLVSIENNTKSIADLIREINIGVLTGNGNSSITTSDIQGFLSANPNLSPQGVANAASQYGVSLQQLGAAGYDTSRIVNLANSAGITDAQIAEFSKSHGPREIYEAAQQYGISSTRLSRATGISMQDINEWVNANRLPSFARGTDFVERSGIAMVHRAEAIVPSSTVDEIRKLREEIVKLREDNSQQAGDVINATDITSKQNARIIADALSKIEDRRQWSDRNTVEVA